MRAGSELGAIRWSGQRVGAFGRIQRLERALPALISRGFGLGDEVGVQLDWPDDFDLL
jgi:hypothetical protein